MATSLVDPRAAAPRRRLVGRGRFGRCYALDSGRTGTPVALKVMSRRRLSAQDVERVRNEIEVHRAVGGGTAHPNVCRFIETVQTPKMLALVLELCDSSLEDRLRSAPSAPIPVPEAKRIAADVASALRHVHSFNVLHRDVKPHNILLLKGRAKLADFGWAVHGPLATGRAGTVAYMAPEMIDGATPYGCMVDVWSLGCVIGAMLGCPHRSPFKGGSVAETIARIVELRPVRSPHPAAVMTALLRPITTREDLAAVEAWAGEEGV